MERSLFDVANIVVLVAILGFFFFMLRHRKQPGRGQPERDLAYEWVSEPADRAGKDFRIKFGDSGANLREAGVALIRLGFFNSGASAIAADETEKPLAVEFAEGAEVLFAEFGEALKGDGSPPPDPVIAGARVEFPPFGIAPGGVVVFNLGVRGDSRPRAIMGAVAGIEKIRRLG